MLDELAGSWRGRGLNLIARPEFQGEANLYLQINATHETLQFTPIGAPIVDRGLAEADVELHGLTYVDTVTDAVNGGELHFETGIWTARRPTVGQPSNAEASQVVARMASIPHGNALLAQGTAVPLRAEFPTLRTRSAQYAGSAFPSFNTTPFRAARPPGSPPINAAGSSLKLTAPALPRPVVPFPQYDLAIPVSATNPRTPFGSTPAKRTLPAAIDGVPMQDVINDPITLLQAVIRRQRAIGHTFSGTAINIATQQRLTFLTTKNVPTGPRTSVSVAGGAGGIENSLFLEGGQPTGPNGPNAEAVLMYGTLWIEQVKPPGQASFPQLQYAQMTVLNFELLKSLPAKHVNLGWPHVSVGTLTRAPR